MAFLRTVSTILLCLFIRLSVVDSATHPDDVGALQSLQHLWDGAPTPSNWVGNDPCGNKWIGIECNDDNSRVINIKLPAMGLNGQLPHEIGGLTELEILNLSYNKGLSGNLPPSVGNLTKLTNLILVNCNFYGPIPDSIGSLQHLEDLSLNSNKFSGQIPASIGKLSNLGWLDLADNELDGRIPISESGKPGLDMLVHAQHFHCGGNKLVGDIPTKLFSSNMRLKHLLLENNQLSGRIPDTLGLVRSLKVVRLDNNSLIGPVPLNLNKLTNLIDLYLSNNRLTGSFPNLTGLVRLEYMNLSNNPFEQLSFPSWYTTLTNLTTWIVDNTRIQGQIPAAFFRLPKLSTVIMSHNKLNGTLSISSPNNLQLVDLRDNKITEFSDRSDFNFQLILYQNPICNEGRTKSYCNAPQPPNISSPPEKCSPQECGAEKVSSPTCKCAYPFTGNMTFRAPSYLENTKNYSFLQQDMLLSFGGYGLPVDSIALSNPRKLNSGYLELDAQIFPSGQDYFNKTGVVSLASVLSAQIYKPPEDYGPYIFNAGTYYANVISFHPQKMPSLVVIGVAISSSVLAILLLLAGVHIFRQKKRAQRAAARSDPFATWAPNKDIGGVPKIKGVKSFSFEELKKYTNNFSDINDIGIGGYGKVYRGVLNDGQLAAIKRAYLGSMQGAKEFKTEIELLSRVHHKNVVCLLGFCFEQGEQMLVYEYIPNGTLKDSLSGKSGIRLDWIRRLRVTLGAARGLLYLHENANPPIIHRDIKSNNILLDEDLNAKVADFGLSKLKGELDRSCVSSQVKGTMGYLDPEYYMTRQLTEKSDVYSFGVVLLELITARNPIEKGIYIVKVVKEMMDTSKVCYDLHKILDPALASSIPTKSLERFVDLAMTCVEEEGVDRPTMSEVVKQIESIMELAGWNSKAGSASTSATSATYDSYPFNYESPYA